MRFQPHSLSLTKKFLSLLGGITFAALFALFVIERFIIMPKLIGQEDQLAHAELERARTALENSHLSLAAQAKDWAHWDDTYDFVQGDRPAYAQTNFSREMYDDFEYQLTAFFNRERSLVWTAGINPETNEYASCARLTGKCAWVQKTIQQITDLLLPAQASVQNVHLKEPLPALVSIAQVLRTDGSGPSNGWVAKVRFIDQTLKSTLEQQLNLPVSLTVRQSSDGAPKPTSIRREADTLRVEGPLSHDHSGPIVYLSTRFPRHELLIQIQVFRYGMLWTGILLISVIGLVLLLLFRQVLQPLSLFTRFIRHNQTPTGQRHYLTDTEVPGKLLTRGDEIGTLARHLKAMLEEQNAQSRKLLQLSMQDPLTSLPNRRAFDSRLEQNLNRPSLQSFSVLMIDIDHFKLYNDHYGHPAGDACLIEVASCLQKTVTGDLDMVARTGGEEFSVLLPRTPEEHAMEIAEHLREAIAALAIPHTASPTADIITLSIGVAFHGASASRISRIGLMKQADDALYEAKRNGRNRVERFSQEQPATS